MHPDMVKLMALQKLDVEARRLREELDATPKRLAALTAKAAAVAGQREVVLKLQAAEEALRRRQESDVLDQRQRITRAKAKLPSATNAAQLNALNHEIEFAEREISRLEDLELDTMMRSEELDKQRAVADRTLAEATEAHTRAREQAVTTLAADKTALTVADNRRIADRTGISDVALSLYDRISRAKGTAVAEALNQKCSACQMLLRPQRWNDLRERDSTDFMTCESCGRLLFYDPARDAPQKTQSAATATPEPARKAIQPERPPERKESIAAQIVRGGR